jgi:hypothetical protein
MTGNDGISFVDYDGADKAELADAPCQRVNLAVRMLAGITWIGFQISDWNIFDSPRLYGATYLVADLFNLMTTVRPGSVRSRVATDPCQLFMNERSLTHPKRGKPVPRFHRVRRPD